MAILYGLTYDSVPERDMVCSAVNVLIEATLDLPLHETDSPTNTQFFLFILFEIPPSRGSILFLKNK